MSGVTPRSRRAANSPWFPGGGARLRSAPPALEKQIGQQGGGIMRETGINWQIGRRRAGPEIS